MTKVRKRNNEIVPFDETKIQNAIEKAMSETLVGVDSQLSKNICEVIEREIIISGLPFVDVEKIQEDVIDKLGRTRPDVAKVYKEYRDNRNKVRNNHFEYRLLDDDFISKYKHKQSNMSPLGQFVYNRTYSRFLPEENRREYWWETVRRAVEYNCSLSPSTTKEEAQQLYDNMFNLRQFLSGRTMWVGGTKVAKDFPIANFNCAFQIIDNINAFSELLYLLMLGSGVGLRILKDDVKKIPLIRTNYTLIHNRYIPVKKEYRCDDTKMAINANKAIIAVGDSKNGWADSMKYFFKLLTDKEYSAITEIIINYNDVRLSGEKLNTFGGTASGHEALLNMFTKIDKVIKKEEVICGDFFLHVNKQLKPIDCLDIANIIGEGVVVGGVRRTAEIVLFDSDDQECVNAKNDLYKEVNGEWIPNTDILHRSMSNNSIFYQEKPTREQLHWQLEQMRYSGEPAWVNQIAGLNRRDDFNGVNPCLIGDTLVYTTEGEIPIKDLVGKKPHVYCMDKDGKLTIRQATEVWKTKSNAKVIKVSTYRGGITCTPDHKIYTTNRGWVEAKDLKKGDKLKGLNKITSASRYVSVALSGQNKKEFMREHRFVASYFENIDGKVIHHKDGNRLNNKYSNLEIMTNSEHSSLEMKNNDRWKDTPRNNDGTFRSKENKVGRKTNDLNRQAGKNWYVINIEEIEETFDVYDMTVPEVHNFVANNIIVHNCGEVLLDNKGMCNLTTVNVMSFVKYNPRTDYYYINTKQLFDAQVLSARAGFRMTLVDLELSEWDKVQKRDRVIGCSLTGWQDMVNATKMNKLTQALLLRQLREVARIAVKQYAKELGINEPLLVTTLKPEGTLSQLPVVSSGIHYSHSPYYIRRIRINAQDPLVKVCEELGYPIKPEVGQTLENCTTKVIEFPVQSPKGRTKYDVSAIEQLENYKMFMENYVDHNCSITVHVREHEWKDVEQWIWDNWNDVVAVSFLSLDDAFYDLMPYEAITEQEYLERKSKMKPFIPSLISKYEFREQEVHDVGNDGCDSGICPIV